MKDKTFLLILNCGHRLTVESRPNPRKSWPDPQQCVECKKKKNVVELHSPRVEAKGLTSPLAPAKYKKKLQRSAKGSSA